MKKAFRDAYNRELAILKERAADFAAEYPGLADRLGGLMQENLDPSIAGLLEGSAFLAARVQVKMDEEFRTFTRELLDQIFPDMLRPVPSAMLVQATAPAGVRDLAQGLVFEAGEYLDAFFNDSDKRVSCRYRLAEPLALWPLELSRLRYHAAPATLGALGQDVAQGTKAGLEIELTRIGVAVGGASGLLSDLALDELPLHFTGPLADAVQLYEQVHAGLVRASLRYEDKNGDPVFLRLAPDSLQQIGFDAAPPLLPHSGALFSGFALLRDAFTFPRRYLGFRLTGLRQALRRIRSARAQLILEFDSSNANLAARLDASHVRLHCAAAVNLFEEFSSQVRMDNRRAEFVVTPDASPATHYEIYSLTEVYAHYRGNQNKVEVLPLYATPGDGIDPRQAMYYTTRQKPRRLSPQEARFGASRYRYRGTETFISVYEPEGQEQAQRLQVKALCSNRHLPEYLPIAQAKELFALCQDQTVTLSCVAGPTAPRESALDAEPRGGQMSGTGDVHWRLISFLSLSFHGLLNDRAGKGAAPLRELLRMFISLSDTISDTQIDGLRAVETRPIVRTLRYDDGFHPARGIEVRLIFDEDEFEGSGIMLLGAVIDRFLAEYAAVNSFTQCVIVSIQRGTIKTWPPRSGTGPLL
ncbi:type VI secretion system baseplate subunit TssF [Tabrizicola aquatica]|uniref:type VI secretion system baseplate subunit TssF n=1 Tax=Tabrizicola aquatica TaxID=909926 RepID=UPI000CD19DCF|nr:type VI secretion system baseplate subunit TssF [Tabrizicola aquatica]